MYSFNILTTYVCTDEVYSDDHPPTIFTFVYVSFHAVYTATVLVTPWMWPRYMPEACVGDFYNKNKNILQLVGTEISVQPHSKRNSS